MSVNSFEQSYVVGVDFGSDSVRAVIVNTQNGNIVSNAMSVYPRWAEKKYQHPECMIFRQHPLDYVEALEACLIEAVGKVGKKTASLIVGLSVDTTGSTPCPVDKNGTPLAMLQTYQENEDAMFWLWKDHSAAKEAELINERFSNSDIDYTRYQGTYSAEWFWAKILHAIKHSPSLCEDAYTWVEHCDWISALLCGQTMPPIRRSACAAGHKALWHSEWNGLPAKQILCEIDPYLGQIYDDYVQPSTASEAFGRITEEWAARLHLPKHTVVGGTSFDAHAGAVGAGIRESVAVINLGTSAVALLVEKAEVLKGKSLSHVCGRAEDSIIPGLIGVETGQAAFGDIYSWLNRLLLWSVKDDQKGNILKRLDEEAEQLSERDDYPIALDWFNGRRYPNTDDTQRSVISGLSLSLTAPALYRSLVFGTVCGLKRIIDELTTEGVCIEAIIAIGGISQKSEYIMHMLADVLHRPISVASVAQTCALGAAIYAAVGAGVYKTIPQAQKKMCPAHSHVYYANTENSALYKAKYNEYMKLAMMFEKT